MTQSNVASRNRNSELSEHWCCFLSESSYQGTFLFFISLVHTVNSHFVDYGSLVAVKAK